MTNEEAAIIVGNIPIEKADEYTIPQYQEAKTMAIKALEQQPKSGEWEKTFESNEAEPFILWECSNCHKTIRGAMKSDYCPNCGMKYTF